MIKQKILVLAHSPNIGGAEFALKNLIESNSTFDWTVVIPSKASIDQRIINSGVKYVQLPLPWWCHESHDSPSTFDRKLLNKNYAELINLANAHDILLTNTITIPWLGFAASELNKPHIWYVHEFGDIDHNLKFITGYDNALKTISNTSSRVLTISNAVKDHIGKVIPKDQIDIIHQAIDFERLINIKTNSSGSGIKLLSMGAIKPSKGQEIALLAVDILHKKNVDLSLDIVGPSANNNYLERLQKLALDKPYVSVQPRSYDIVEELSSHNALLMTSSNEALGRVTIEAMAAKIPVLGYSSPSTKYLLNDNRGLLYSVNSPTELASIIELFISNPSIVDTSSAQQYVLKSYSHDIQNKNFEISIKRALKSSNNYSENLYDNYYRLLLSKNLLVSKSEVFIRDIKPTLVKATPKKIRKIYKSIVS